MRKQIALGTALALGMASHAMAAADAFSYNNVDAAFTKGDIGYDGGEGRIDADGNGFSLSGSAEFSESLFGFASFGSTSLDDVKFEGTSIPSVKMKAKLLSAGVGFHWPLAESLDFVSGVSFERVKLTLVDSGSTVVSTSDNGYGVSAGLRGRVGGSLELTGTLKYIDIGGSEMVYSMGGRYYFTDAFAAGIDYAKYDDSKLSIWGISVRYDFGAK